MYASMTLNNLSDLAVYYKHSIPGST